MADTGHGSGSVAPGSTSSSLLEQLKKQDPEAWIRLSDLYGPLVYRWCRQLGLRADDAADVAQEVFSAVLARIDRFHRDRDGDSFHGWLFAITRNKVRNHFRRLHGEARGEGGTDAQRRLAEIPSVPPNGSSATVQVLDDAGTVHAALAAIRGHFEDQTWDAFWRTTVGGETGGCGSC